MKVRFVEQALLHYVQALDEIPAEYVIHTRIVVSRKTAGEMLQKAKSPKPTPALRKLMRGRD